MYRAIDKPSYTRREYITGIPGSKIAQHKMGEVDSNEDDYPVQISLIVEEECQIRHGALEASRLSANRFLLKNIGETGYKMILRKFPHQVLRENKQRPVRVRTVFPTECDRRSVSRSERQHESPTAIECSPRGVPWTTHPS